MKKTEQAAQSRNNTNELMAFHNDEFGSVRTLTINGEPYFIGKDVADILGYSNSRDALSRHVDDEDKNCVVIHDGITGNPNQVVINESGLYSLILSSKLPAAKRFKRWATSDVLPSIHKRGAYTVEQKPANPADTLREMANALLERADYIDGLRSKLADARAERDKAKTALYLHDHYEDVFSFINDCVRSYAGIQYHGSIGWAWHDYYDMLLDATGKDLRQRPSPFIRHLRDDEVEDAIECAKKLCARDLNALIDSNTLTIVNNVQETVWRLQEAG